MDNLILLILIDKLIQLFNRIIYIDILYTDTIFTNYFTDILLVIILIDKINISVYY